MHVTVKTPSRIHLGLIDLNGELGRIYGSIGLALNEPSMLVEAKPADETTVAGDGSDRAKAIMARFNEVYETEQEVALEVKQAIPEHVGLGSGTQMALSVGSALANINKLSIGVKELAKSLGRGTVSGIGVEAFRKGGFIIDSGRKKDFFGDIPFAVHRLRFPEDWSFILAIPAQGRGISGNIEEEAFKRIVPAPAETAKNICRIMQMKMLPSLIEGDIEVFGASLMEVDREVGSYFKEVQDGIYAEKNIMEMVEFMLESGAYGAGQSSWGPAVYGLIDDSKAKDLEAEVSRFYAEKDIEATIIRTHANNHGAGISVLDD